VTVKPARLHDRPADLALILALLSFPPGVLLPVLEVQRFIFFTDIQSLAGLTWGLLTGGEVLLGLVVLVFTIGVPGAKIAGLVVLRLRGDGHPTVPRLLRMIDAIGRWSMLDVLVLALVIVTMKANGFATAASQPGLYCFVTAAIATTVAAARLRRRGGEE